MYEIIINDLKLFGYHGVNESEKKNGQDFIFNIKISLDYAAVSKKGLDKTDSIDNTVNYSEVIAIIKKVNRSAKFDLLETLTRTIAEEILSSSDLIKKVSVKAEKPDPPIAEDLKSVGIICEICSSASLEELPPASAGAPRTSAGAQRTSAGAQQTSAGTQEASARVFLSLGSNLGDREQNLRAAVARIGESRNINILKVSSIYETSPMYVEDQAPFYNIALEAEVSADYSPFELLGYLKSLEYRMGRQKDSVRFGPRVIDMDILYFGDQKISSDFLKIPHPLIKERRFVLIPLSEISPGQKVIGVRIDSYLKEAGLDEKVIKIKKW